MADPHTFKNKLGANIEIDQLRGNSFNYYHGCTIDIKINVYSDDLSRKYSFWLLNHDTGWDGDGIMDGIYESELECNENFSEDMELGDIYSEEELDQMAWDAIFDGYEVSTENCPFLDYILRIEDAISKSKAECEEEEGVDVIDESIMKLFDPSDSCFWENMSLEEIIDFERMAKEKNVELEDACDAEDYAALVEDFSVETADSAFDEEEKSEPASAIEQAISFCKSHDSGCLLLPYIVCVGMRDTHFVAPRGLLKKVYDLLGKTDCIGDDADKLLMPLRSLILSELKQSKWVDIKSRPYRKYTSFEDYIYNSHQEILELEKLLSRLCQGNGRNIEIDCPFEYSVDKTADILRLRNECGVVIPEKIAYDFIVDAQLKASYSQQLLHQELTYYTKSYRKTRLTFIRDEVFELIDENYLSDTHISGLYDAGIVLKEYPSDSFAKGILDSESDDDSFTDINENGGIRIHGIRYECSDYLHSVFGNDDDIVRGQMTVISCERAGYVHIPGKVVYHGKEYPVTRICYDTFSEASKIIIDEGVTKIDCDFNDCPDLRSISIPASLTELKEGCFDGCEKLEEIIIAKGNPRYAFKDGSLFDIQSGDPLYTTASQLKTKNSGKINFKDGDLQYSVKDGVLTVSGYIGGDSKKRIITQEPFTRLVIEEGVTRIESSAFYAYPQIESVEFPSTLTYIGHHAFDNCKGLTSLYIPGNVREVKSEAFSCCSGLKSIVIGDGVGNIEVDAFWKCTGLKEITVLGKDTEIAYMAFSYCSQIEKFSSEKYYSINGVPESAFPWSKPIFEQDGIFYKPYWCREMRERAVCVAHPFDGRGKAPEGYMQMECLDIPSEVSYYGLTYKVRKLERAAFVVGGAKVRVINLPETLVEIEDGWIYDLSIYSEITDNLIAVNVHPDNPKFSSENGILFNKEKTCLLCFPASNGLISYDIPDGVETVKGWMHSKTLASLHLPVSVHRIGIENCPHLRTVTVDKGNPVYNDEDGVLYMLCNLTGEENKTRIWPRVKANL